ncbi:MAG: methyltransferase domain-containing protein [Candidatus Paceibacterota bacterium]|jgi:ubiquinone/menaquinone biosynthesis C-methylase UbiE/uncharacterized protein YbaR (Trm112 family)
MEKYYQNLSCPDCKNSLVFLKGSFSCPACKKGYRLEEGIPVFLNDEQWEKWQKEDIVYNPYLQGGHFLSSTDFYAKYGRSWQKVADIGGGDGVNSAELAEEGKDVYVLNPGFLALQKLQKRGIPGLHPICCEGENIPFADEFFDGVLNIFVIEHLSDPFPILKEIRRVLKKEGEAVIGTDNRFYDKYGKIIKTSLLHAFNKNIPIHSPNKTHINLMMPKDLRSILKKANFEITKEEILRPQYLDPVWGSIPKGLREEFMSGMFIFTCKPIK